MPRWLPAGVFVAAILALAARPAWEILAILLHDPLSDHGAAVFSFVNERPDDVRVVGLRLGGDVRLDEGTSGRGFTMPGPAGRGTMSPAMLSERQGRQTAEIQYRLGDSEQVSVFRFDVELIAQSQCDVITRFDADGPRVNGCHNHRPASYGGTWRH
ncbi:hypothetical protein [Sediminicoccus sp. BL-A-41-H5]|uniref:hypothetical protein n=1 Tax=Sediminicoccus sp. BL-A-41-H5 TaxID=3421106 RepID=UPI003D67E55F